MPSLDPVLSVRELVEAFARGVRSLDPQADLRRGSLLELWGGVGAILFAREAIRDRDTFRAIFLDTASGKDLARIVRERTGIARIDATHGRGRATLRRPSSGGGGGTIWQGTRFLVPNDGAAPLVYLALESVVVAAGVTVIDVPVRAAREGSGTAISRSGEGIAYVDDPLWDPSWRVVHLVCGDGLNPESAPELLARARRARLERRSGYAKAISEACVRRGAVHVALFGSNEGGDEIGLNACYVAESNFASPRRLLRDCTVALEAFRVCGADLQVMGMRRVPLTLEARVTLWDDPGRFPLVSLERRLGDALRTAFAGQGSGYVVQLDALAGALLDASDAIQNVEFTSPTKSLGVRVGDPPNFPPELLRYTIERIQFRFVPQSSA